MWHPPTPPHPYLLPYFAQIQDIVKMPQLLTVFRIDEEKNYDVDVAILQAFLKGAMI